MRSPMELSSGGFVTTVFDALGEIKAEIGFAPKAAKSPTQQLLVSCQA